MEPYEISTMKIIPGNTPREKYDHLLALMKANIAFCFPRRGTAEETASREDFCHIIEPHILIPTRFEDITGTSL